MSQGRVFLLAQPVDGWPGSTEAGSSGVDAHAVSDRVFTGLVERHAELMYRIAFSVLRNPQDAEDAVQESFLKLYRGAAWRQMRDERAFLARTVWRVALDHLPRRRDQQIGEGHEEMSGKSESPEAEVMHSAQAQRLRGMIDALPADFREVLILSAIKELTSREVGVLLGIPEGTVRRRLMRARDELKRRFEALEKKGR